MTTIENRPDVERLREEANRFYEALMKLPRPRCYASLHPETWEGVVETCVEDLMRLAYQDGCVGAAWALSMLEAAATPRRN